MTEHQEVMGICYPNKCYVPVPTKKEYDEKAAMVDEHEQRLANITKEVDGALSCASVTTSGDITSGGTITSTGKINANGGLAVTSLTASGTITATGLINANGGIKIPGDIVGNLKGNVTGSISGGTVAGTTGTFSGAVTAKSFNPTSYTTITVNGQKTKDSKDLEGGITTLLPYIKGYRYTGHIYCYVDGLGSYTATVNYKTNPNSTTWSSVSASGLTYLDIPLSNALMLIVSAPANVLSYPIYSIS